MRYAGRMRLTIAIGACGTAFVVMSCSLFVDLDGLDDGAACTTCDDAATDAPVTDAKTSGDGGNVVSDATAGDGSSSGEAGCPSGKGPDMVQSGSLCIDSTEVSQHDYGVFFSAIGGASGAVTRPPECAWKSNTATGCGNGDPFPVACVDWCDAVAYCAWAGKRLCGKVGDGAALAFPLAGNRASSEWSFACSPTGNTYPYGATYEDRACNTLYVDGGVPPGGTVAVGSLSSCVGGLPGLFDMGGNVEEWLNSCETNDGGLPTDPCHEGGDCFDYSSTGLARCDGNDNDQRNFQGSDVGIRCCATP
jgi:sulfatase modifying factor 1